MWLFKPDDVRNSLPQFAQEWVGTARAPSSCSACGTSFRKRCKRALARPHVDGQAVFGFLPGKPCTCAFSRCCASSGVFANWPFERTYCRKRRTQKVFPRVHPHVVVKVMLASEALEANLALVGFVVDVLVKGQRVISWKRLAASGAAEPFSFLLLIPAVWSFVFILQLKFILNF